MDTEGKGELFIPSIASFLAKLGTGIFFYSYNNNKVNGLAFSSDDSYKIMQYLEKSCTGKVTWTGFKKEFEQWICLTDTHTLLSDKLEYGVRLSLKVFFIIFRKAK